MTTMRGRSWWPNLVLLSYARTSESPRAPRGTTPPYIGHWLQVREDKQAIFQAAAHAQQAVDFLHGLPPVVEPFAADAEGTLTARYSLARVLTPSGDKGPCRRYAPSESCRPGP